MEQTLVATLIRHPEQLAHYEFNTDHLTDQRCNRLLMALLEMHRNGEAIDKLLVNSRLPELKGYVFELPEGMPEVTVGYYLQQLEVEYFDRKLREVSENYLRNPSPDNQFVMMSTIKKLTQREVSEKISTEQALDQVIESLQDEPDYLPTGFRKLNSVIGGLRPGGMYVVAARPGIGKTMFALQLAYDLAAKNGVLFFSLEMSRSELLKRIICSAASLTTAEVLNGAIKPEHFSKVEAIKAKFNYGLTIDDKPGVTVDRIRTVFHRENEARPVKAIFIDYLGLMEDISKSSSRYEKVTNISNDLKRLARELNVPIVALHQLNREVENRKDGSPQLADLRDSGAIEQDADVVMLLHRKLKTELGERASVALDNELFLAVAKNRHGSMEVIKFLVHPAYVRVQEI
jgi:replicative DNA helicase